MKQNYLFIVILLFSLFCVYHPSFAEELKGEKIIEIPWGDTLGHVGSVSRETAFLDFISPTSFMVDDSGIYVLDAPNFRIYRINEKGDLLKLADLPKGKNKYNLFTDLTRMSDGTILVASSREGNIYRLSATGKLLKRIVPDFDVKMITRIAADEKGQILLEDPENGKMLIVSQKGKLIDSVDVSHQPVLLADGSVAHIDYQKKDKLDCQLKIRLTKIGKLTSEQQLIISLTENIQNFQLLGELPGGGLMIYLVTGKYNDNPDGARVVKVDSVGKILGQIKVPELPGFSTMRYIRMENANTVIFAEATEAGYLLSRFRF